jgi:citrate lyase subunit beta/citryl-CoA lyase
MAASVRAARGKLGPRIIALIESAEGLAGATEIAGIPLVARLAIGEADLGADLGIDATLPETTWLPIRLQIVIASAAASLDAPVGPVLTDFRNDSRLKESTVGLKRIGFGARAAIHPRQVAVINEAFIPSADEVAAARDLVTRFEQARATGAAVMISDDGTMADEATVRHARLILERAGPSTGS